MRDIKHITIHGPGTCYKCVIFKLGDNPVEQSAGYGGPHYVGMIILEPDVRRVLIDREDGYPPWAFYRACLDDSDYVLRRGWGAVLRHFDEIPDGGNIEVTRRKVKITDKWRF